jgi:uncharacterized membrane protein
METAIGVYESHEKAVIALRQLQESGYPVGQLSILAKAGLVDNHIHIKTGDAAEKAEVSIGVVAGTILGVLTGVGIFAIPGLGFLFGAGALVGAFAGLDVGIMTGGLAAIFTRMGVDAKNATQYEKHLNDGNFVLFAQGDLEQIKEARKVIQMEGLPLELDRN